MTTNKTAFVRKHLEAATSMLLGKKVLKPSAAMIAGQQIDEAGRMQLAQLASTGGLDIVHLEFGETTDGFGLVGISTIMPREGSCYAFTGCRLYLEDSDAQALILPRAKVAGMFKLAPGELIHIDRKPSDAEAGIARAEARLQALVESGVEVERQVKVRGFSPLAYAQGHL